MNRREKLLRIAELARELNELQQECLGEVDMYARHTVLEDMADDAEEAVQQET